MRNAFSLMELLIVIVVMGILGGLGYQQMTEITMDSKAAELKDQLKKIKVGLVKYNGDLGTFPYFTRFLTDTELDTDNYTFGFDSLEAKASGGGDGVEDLDILSYWSGPYVQDMLTIDAPELGGNRIKAKLGDYIQIGAIIADPADDVNIVQDVVGADYTDPSTFVNVLSIKGLDPESINYLFKHVNGHAMSAETKTKGNAYAVATGTTGDRLGIPAPSEYVGANQYVIYRFADDIQN
jgi:prepilin-type N-terminal cleavage/methylation domain-containing protein